MKTLLTLLCIILFFQSCSSAPVIKAVASSDQKTGYDGAVISQKKHLVSLSLFTDFKTNKYINAGTPFNMIIQNLGEKPISINIKSISAMFEEDDRDRSLKPMLIMPKFAFDISPMPANRRGLLGDSLPGWTLHNAVELNEALGEANMQHERDKRNDLKILNDVQRKTKYLMEYTIMPGEGISDVFFCSNRDFDLKTEGRFKIVITVDGEKHEFAFLRSIEP